MTDKQDKIQKMIDSMFFGNGLPITYRPESQPDQDTIDHVRKDVARSKHLARIAQLETEVSKWKNAHKTISDLLNERVIECERLRQRLEVTNKAIGAALERSVQRDGHPRIDK